MIMQPGWSRPLLPPKKFERAETGTGDRTPLRRTAAAAGPIVSNAVCQCVSASNRRSRRVLKASLSTVAGTGVAVAVAAAAPAALPPERSFDAGRAHLFYKMAASSYCPAPDVLAWDCPPCRATNLSAAVAPRIFSEVLTGASGFVGAFGAGGDTLVLSFRGSENLQNWVENLKIAKTDRNMSCAGCKVHSGG